jgi:hypothetical protein
MWFFFALALFALLAGYAHAHSQVTMRCLMGLQLRSPKRRRGSSRL